jgi:hypothetical protein
LLLIMRSVESLIPFKKNLLIFWNIWITSWIIGKHIRIIGKIIRISLTSVKLPQRVRLVNSKIILICSKPNTTRSRTQSRPS